MRSTVDTAPTPVLVLVVVGVWSAGAIAVIFGLSLVVLLTLQFPFSGGLAIDSSPLEEGELA